MKGIRTRTSSRLIQWISGLVMTCEEVTRLSFDAPEETKLSLSENLKLKIHRSLCIWCRRYYKQSRFLQEAMMSCQRKHSDGFLSEKKMNADVKERIINAMADLSIQ